MRVRGRPRLASASPGRLHFYVISRTDVLIWEMTRVANNKRYEEHPFAFVLLGYIAAGSEMLSVLPPPVGCCLCTHLSVCLIMLLLVPPQPHPVRHEPQVMRLRHKYGPIGEGTFGTCVGISIV